jgi:Ca2+-binding RTX toxin-like protein
MVHLVKHDLEFILKQIKIGEANSVAHSGAAATPLSELVSHHLLPYGLRTVDGSYNNLVPGQEWNGAADQIMPRLLNPVYLPADPNPRTGAPTSYQNPGNVYDADPRVISNLIGDQSLDNPAAIQAALVYAGVADADLMPALSEIQTARAALDAALANAGPTPAEILAFQKALEEAEADAAAAAAAAATAQAQAQAAEDAYDAALAEVGLARQGVDAAQEALLVLAVDGIPTSAQQAEIDAAFAALEAAALVLDAKELLATNAQATMQASAATAVEKAAASAAADAAVLTAQQALTDAQEASGASAEAIALARSALNDTLAEHGVVVENGSVVLPNVSADLGDTAPFNGFFTLFGQFFDHGLDLVSKGDNGTVYIPLQPDDPLYVEGSPTNFMVLTRATPVRGAGADGQMGTADDTVDHRNETTPWIDLNQVYTSNPSHQVFLREYVLVDGRPMATGHMLEGVNGGPATWADVKLQARTILGIELTDADVLRVPALLTDVYGEFVRGANGLPQLVTANGPLEGNIGQPVAASQAFSAGRAFLNDIAHTAAPSAAPVDHDRNPATAPVAVTADADDVAGNPILPNQFGIATTYDNELLDRHVIVGDGRGNENIGLTSIHHVFHSEHNRMVEETKKVALESGDLAFLNEWLLTDVAAFPATQAEIDALAWDGERLFQAGRFSTEMVYQHLVFEEFARAVAPDVDPFLFSNTTTVSGAIVAEFAHVVYRFGHSMLNENIDIISMGQNGPAQSQIGLIDAFLNPIAFGAAGTNPDEAAGAILRGMTRQAGNEIDEFLTGALRNNLVGLPLDLGAVNIARARETGVPSLNEARRQFYADTQDSRVKPYDSWHDFALSLKNPASVINFIAAYGTHSTITSATTLEAKRAAATALVLGGTGAPQDRLDFLNGTGSWANAANGATITGLDTVDFWIGGLAEKKMTFGSMLGSTFTYVFEYQMEQLQAGDRFYYLSRTQGLNLLNELEADSFAQLIMRNTSLGDGNSTHVNGAAFQTADYILEMDMAKQIGADPTHSNPILQAISPMVIRKDLDGDGDADFLRYTGTDHVVLGGTNENDTLIGGEGDDTLWGDAGNDSLEGGYGVDHLHGGDGDDIITDSGTDIGAADVIHGDAGNDVINPGSGLDLVFGGSGQDFIFGGTEAKNISGGLGSDFIRGGTGINFLAGNEGDDWIEGGESFDTLAGENSELFFNSTIIGHDVLNGRGNDNDYDAESGDDIMFQNEGIERNNGMAGFDWAIHKGHNQAADSDMRITIFQNQQNNILRDRFDLVEGLSGWKFNDKLTGRDVVMGSYDANGNAAEVQPGSPLESYSNALLEKNVQLISGLSDLVAHLQRTTVVGADGKAEVVVMDTSDASEILLGGAGSDTVAGGGGNDIIDGDKWLNVRIRITVGNEIYTSDGLDSKIYREADYKDGAVLPNAVAQFGGKTLQQTMFDRTLNPGQLSIVREIVDGGQAADKDVAVYWDVRDNYTFTLNDDGSVTVEHVTVSAQVDPITQQNRVSDGIDRLFNIERLRFSDGNGGTVEFDIDNLINRPATGVPVISDLTPTEGQQLTVDVSGIQDGNGLGAFAYQWQSSANGTTWTNIAGATGAAFTPQDLAGTAFGAQAGLQLRVVVSFTDGGGNAESVTTAATRPVGVNWDGNAASDNTLNGTAGDDIGDGVDPFLIFFGGNDVLNGNDGNDSLNGAGGNDTLNGGAGNDTLNGGSGTDVAVFAGQAGDYDYGLNASGQITMTDRPSPEGSDTLTSIEQLRFTGLSYTLNNGTNAGQTLTGGTVFNANRADILLGHGGNDTLNGNGGNDILVGGAGNDTVNGGDGNDLIVQVGGTDGRDRIDGGAGIDTYHLNGSAGAETFTIYSRTAALAAINGLTLAVNTEIVIVRDGVVIAELDNIEEIRVNTLQVTSPGGSTGGASGGDTIQVVGSFNGTSLNFSTITIDGNEGDDTVDISALQSAHRIVYRSNGGHDTIVGTLRQQDVIELPPGRAVGDYTRTVNADGTITLASATHSVTYRCEEAQEPVVRECAVDDDMHHSPSGQPVAGDDSFALKKGEVLNLTVADLLANDVDPDGDALCVVSVDEDEHGTVALNDDGTLTFTPKAGFIGTASFTYRVEDGNGGHDEGRVTIVVSEETSNPAQPPAEQPTEQPPAEQPPVNQPPVVEQPVPATPLVPEDLVCRGGHGHDRLWGGDGHDRMYGDKGHDRLYGGGGNDRLYGQDGNDRLCGDAGADRMWGGRGNDTYLVDDRGDRVHEGRNQGTDTVKASVSYSLAGTHVEKLVLTGSADLNATGNSLDNILTGNGGNNTLRGGAGHDVLKGGAGDDVLKGGTGHDRLTGGTGADTFVFERGGGFDTVTDFRHGQDKIDVSGLAGVEQKSDLHLWQMGSDTMIWHGSDVLVLKGVTASDLDNGDFIF